MLAISVCAGCSSAGLAAPPTSTSPAPASTTTGAGSTTTTVHPTTTVRPSATTTTTTSTTTTTTTTTTISRTSTTTTISTTSTSTSTTSTPAPTTVAATTLPPLAPAGTGLRVDTPAPDLVYLAAQASTLPVGNIAVSVTVLRDGVRVFGGASGVTNAGGLVTTDTPFVIASVSKLVTALTIARLAQSGRIQLDAPVPWTALGLSHDPGWDGVTIRELLAHTSGMPSNRKSWLDLPGSCAVPLAEAIALPPLPSRGTWAYSNGNYCALGLLIEQITGGPIDVAAQKLVFGPAGIEGPHLSLLGALPDDAPYWKGVARLERLGGAGTWLASSDDLAAMLAAITPADFDTLRWPGIFTDQYGWGHTGTLDGAKACAWVMESGRTIVTAIVSGDRPSTGGGVCDELLPALAVDLGVYAGDPVRSPD